jgi:hypothetical protein
MLVITNSRTVKVSLSILYAKGLDVMFLDKREL